MDVKDWAKRLNELCDEVVKTATVEESIQALYLIDQMRKRIDRIQANPTGGYGGRPIGRP